jgi:hypothetical protein
VLKAEEKILLMNSALPSRLEKKEKPRQEISSILLILPNSLEDLKDSFSGHNRQRQDVRILACARGLRDRQIISCAICEFQNDKYNVSDFISRSTLPPVRFLYRVCKILITILPTSFLE